MGKMLEIVIFVLISIFLGFIISVPLFFLSTQDPQNIDILGIKIEGLNIYKTLIIFLVIVTLIYFIIRNIILKFRQNENTRKYILKNYPKGVSHFYIFISQILPSLFPSWLKFLLIVALIFFGIPRLIGFWFTNTLFDIQKGSLINIILSIILTQLILAPISILLLLYKYFDRKRMNDIDEKPIVNTNEINKTNKIDNTLKNDEHILEKPKTMSIFLKRCLASLIDTFISVIVIIIFVFLFQNIFRGSFEEESVFQFLTILVGLIAYFIINSIQLNILITNGFTIGKYFLKLRVVDSHMNNITSQQAVYREIVLKLFAGMMYFSFIIFFFNKKGYMLHDVLLGTKVIK